MPLLSDSFLLTIVNLSLWDTSTSKSDELFLNRSIDSYLFLLIVRLLFPLPIQKVAFIKPNFEFV